MNDSVFFRPTGNVKPGGIMIVLDYPTKYNLRFKGHFVRDDERLMAQILGFFGLKLADCYITFAYKKYVDKWTVSVANPNAEEAMHELLDEVRRVQPKKILAMGGLAHAFLNGELKQAAVRKVRGMAQWYKIDDLKIFGVCTIPSYFVQGEPDLFRDLLRDVEKLVTKHEPETPPKVRYVVCQSYAHVVRELARLREAKVIACDTETSGLHASVDYLEAIGFGAITKDGIGYCVIIPMALMRNEDIKDAIYALMIGRNFNGALVFHNSKFDLQFLNRWLNPGRPISKVKIQDTLLMHYLLDERPVASRNSPHGLKTISRVRYDTPDYSFDFDEFWSSPPESRDWNTLYRYLAFDLTYTARLYSELKKEIEEEDPRLFRVLDEFLLPAAVALSEVELHGAPVDRDYLRGYQKQLEQDLQHIITGMKDYLVEMGYPKDKADGFNPGSPKQVSDILYDFFRLPKPAPEGYWTDKNSLRDAIFHNGRPEANQMLELILDYRETAKVLSTYVKGLLNFSESDGSVHTQFNLGGTSTGRLSANDPALQTIPQLSGPDVRRAFVAPMGFIWFKCDYSQLELRVACHYSKDQKLLQAYRDDRDIHIEVAAAMFQIPPEQVTKKQRYAAKFVDFGVMYGRGAQSLAYGPELREYGWNERQAQRFIDNYLNQFPQLRDWMNEQRIRVIKEQELSTDIGRKRRWPFLNRQEANAAQRQALNFPIQSTASDITLSALIKLYHRLQGMRSRIVVTVHDEIDLLVWYDEALEVAEMVFDCMENDLPIQTEVPIVAEVEFGNNWADLNKWHRGKMAWWFDIVKEEAILTTADDERVTVTHNGRFGPCETHSSARAAMIPF